MRYHWGLGVGHLHAHCLASTPNDSSSVPDELRGIESDQNEPGSITEDASNIDCATSDACVSDKLEWELDNRDLEGWEDETDSGNDDDCRSELDSESENSDGVGM
jgi:hypothetical protein